MMKNKTLAQMNLLDNFLFGATLGYRKHGKEVSEIMLRTILGREVKIREVVSEKVILPSKPGLHGVRLDAFIEEDGTEVEPQNIYDLEPDRKEGEKSSLPKRIRYYHSKIDMHYLESSEKYQALPQVWVIFITSFDPFGKNRLVYTIRNHCEELPGMAYDDGARTLLLYVDGDPADYPKELPQLLAYMKNSTPENACNPDLKQIHSCVDKVKKDPKIQEVFMTLEEYVEREKNEERRRAEEAEKRAKEAEKQFKEAENQVKEAKNQVKEAENQVKEAEHQVKEAKNQAKEAENRADNAEKLLANSIRRLMNASNCSEDDAMDILSIAEGMRDYYKAML